MEVNCFTIAQRFVGVKETPGVASTPLVLAMLRLDDQSVADDQTPWCSAFASWIAWLLRLPRSKSLAARSWLHVGRPIALEDAIAADDIVVLERGAGGHVGFYAGRHPDGSILILGGNQSDAVTIAAFAVDRLLGVRRLIDR
jgi:uncharacterized protein (TIGR02594 family)